MSTDPVPGSGGLPPEFVALLRSILGDQAEDAIEALSEAGFDPNELLSAAGLENNPAAFAQAITQMQAMLSRPSSGPVNWDIAHDIARQAAVGQGDGDPTVTEGERRAVTQALAVADLWLDQVTELPSAAGQMVAMSRSDWVEATLPTWRKMCEPIAASVSNALAEALAKQGQEHPGMPEVAESATTLLRVMGGTLFGMQAGQAVGTLSREVFGLTDIGLPLVAEPTTALLPSSVAAFGEGLDTPLEEVRLYLAVREAAHARLFAHVPWLGGHLLGAVEAYARGITVDTETLEESVRSIDPTDPHALREAMSSGLFDLHPTQAQKVSLERLETALALVEGWVDEVSAAAASPHLPHTNALREMIRRRRAAGGPAEHTFATLVGLQLRPRRAREAAALWAAIGEELGQVEREELWGHPDLLPESSDLDDPAGFAARRRAQNAADEAVDAAIAELLGGSDSAGPPTDQLPGSDPEGNGPTGL